MTNLEAFLRALTASSVEFVIVEGVAAGIHGSVRAATDADLLYSRASANLERLASALASAHPYLRGAPTGLPFRWDAETLRRGLNFTLVTDLGDVDLLGEIVGGGTYEDLKDQTIRVRIFGVECLCLDLATLIHVKRAAGRPKDLEAIAELEKLLELKKRQS